MKEQIIFIVGPTSSGKTSVSIALAQRIKAEIISCDSMQVYRDMDIINQAPSDPEMGKVPHHLIKTIGPEQEYSAADFRENALVVIKKIHNRSSIPIVVGGTGLYVKALLDGLFPSPPKDEELRKELEELESKKGKGTLYGILKNIDASTAEKLHVNDLKRIIRAIEVFELTGEPISSKKHETCGIFNDYDCRLFGLTFDRQILYERINIAVDKMFDEGLIEEVKGLLERPLGKTARKALGIKEISAFLNKEISLDEAKEELKKNTRRYAKRQLTWFRADPRIEWINADRPLPQIVDEIIVKTRK